MLGNISIDSQTVFQPIFSKKTNGVESMLKYLKAVEMSESVCLFSFCKS